MIAWTLSERAKAPEAPHEIDATRLGRLADSSLRMAATLAPMDVGYRLAVGRFLLASGVALTRSAARGHFQKALERARAGKLPALHAEAALAYGRTFWWRYDVFANRRMPNVEGFAPNSVTDAMQPLARTATAAQEMMNLQAAAELLGLMHHGGSYTIEGVLANINKPEVQAALQATASEAESRYAILPQTSMKAARDLIETSTSAMPPDVTGAADFENAVAYFREAYDADPTFPGAFRAVAMIYADRALWRELESFAHNHLTIAPRDSLAWMTLGLAEHRLEKESAAATAFDSAFAIMSPDERNRLDDWRRVMPLRHGSFAQEGSESERAAAQVYWMFASPLWADNGNITKVEFLSRVTYAELRWTVEEFRLSGADTDRGDIHVRYGPPEKIALIGPRGSDNAADIVTFWMYSSGLMFAFRGMPTFATAHTAYGDGAIVDAIRQVQPVRWDNVSTPRTDSLPVQVARFRAGRDSVDLFVAVHLGEPEDIKKTMSVVGEVRRFFWLVAPGSAPRYSNAGTVDSAGVYSVSRRIGPAALIYRIEEFGETAKRAGRATGVIDANTTAFPLSGFGVSDILLGVNAAPLGPAVTKWSNVKMAPIAGTVAQGAQLAIVWENYDFVQHDGEAQYEVAITVKRMRSGAGRILATVASALDATIHTQTESDRVVFRFERAVPYTKAFVDQMILALGDTPAGSYEVTLEVRDRTSTATTSRTTTLTIRD